MAKCKALDTVRVFCHLRAFRISFVISPLTLTRFYYRIRSAGEDQGKCVRNSRIRIKKRMQKCFHTKQAHQMVFLWEAGLKCAKYLLSGEQHADDSRRAGNRTRRDRRRGQVTASRSTPEHSLTGGSHPDQTVLVEMRPRISVGPSYSGQLLQAATWTRDSSSSSLRTIFRRSNCSSAESQQHTPGRTAWSGSSISGRVAAVHFDGQHTKSRRYQ